MDNDTAFSMRRGTLELLQCGQYNLTSTASCLLWFLLFHGWYDPNSPWFGYVDVKVTDKKFLCAATGRNRNTVGRALEELEGYGFIRRTKRYDKVTGNRKSDRVQLLRPDDFCWRCRSRGHGEQDCAEPML